MKHKILIAVTLMIFSACMKVKKKEDDAPAAVAQAQQVPFEKQVEANNMRTEFQYSYEVSETTQFHKVHFFAPSDWPTEMIVTKVTSTGQNQIVATFNGQGEWVDNLIPDEKVNYKFFTKLEKDGVPLAEVDVLPVIDLIIQDADVDLYEKYQITTKTKVIHIRNLDIQSQKHLFIENFSGTIVVDNLKSENGFIQTFQIDSRAADDNQGKDGGQVKLVIKNGLGQLAVVMKGQNGGNGGLAKDPDKSMIGAQGARAEEAKFTPSGDLGPFGLSQGYRCIKNPGESNYGVNGGRGNKGNIGQNGGNSGSVAILNSNQNLDITVINNFGSGGKLSQGGTGGEGGEPGDIADGAQEDLDIYLIKTGTPLNPVTKKPAFGGFVTQACPASIKKSRGKPGPDGFPGAHDGEDGIIQPSYLNSQKIQNPN